MRAGLLEKSSASCYNGKENFWKGGVRLEKIRLAAAMCIKGRLQPPCHACEDVCPVGAFRWGVPHPELCIDCGLCTAVCPAAAVETRLDYAVKLTAVVAADAPSVRLACAKSAPDSTLPCLGFLTRGILWAIASQKEVQLDISSCRACLPAVHAHLAREAAATDAALAAAGRAPLRLLDAEPAAREYSRRDFFRRFRDVAKEKFGQEDAAGGAGGVQQGSTTLGLPSVWRAALQVRRMRAQHRQRRMTFCRWMQREWGKTPCSLHSLRSPLPPGHSLMAHSPLPCMLTSRSTAAAMPAASVPACVRTGRCKQASRPRTSCSPSCRSSAPLADSAPHAARRAPCASPPPPPPSAGASRCRAANPAAHRFSRSARVRSAALAWRDESKGLICA